MIPKWIIGDYCQSFWDEEEFNNKVIEITEGNKVGFYLYKEIESLSTNEKINDSYVKKLLMMCYYRIKIINDSFDSKLKDIILHFYISQSNIDGVKETCLKINQKLELNINFTKKYLTYQNEHLIKYKISMLHNAKTIFDEKTIRILYKLYLEFIGITENEFLEVFNAYSPKEFNKRVVQNMIIKEIKEYNEKNNTNYIVEYKEGYLESDYATKNFIKHIGTQKSNENLCLELLNMELIYKVIMKQRIVNEVNGINETWDDESFVVNLSSYCNNNKDSRFYFCTLGDDNNILNCKDTPTSCIKFNHDTLCYNEIQLFGIKKMELRQFIIIEIIDLFNLSEIKLDP
jgi:hypothetical protein